MGDRGGRDEEFPSLGSPMPDAALYKVAYDEAVRALSEQQAAIESVPHPGGPVALGRCGDDLVSRRAGTARPRRGFRRMLGSARLRRGRRDFPGDPLAPRLGVHGKLAQGAREPHRVCGGNPNRRSLSRSLASHAGQLLGKSSRTKRACRSLSSGKRLVDDRGGAMDCRHSIGPLTFGSCLRQIHPGIRSSRNCRSRCRARGPCPSAKQYRS